MHVPACHGWIDGSAEWERRDSGQRTPETIAYLARLANGSLLGLDVALHGISLSYGLSLKSSQAAAREHMIVHYMHHPSIPPYASAHTHIA